MSRIAPFALAAALPFTALSTAALADLTPAQVWGDWRTYMEGAGYTITANEVDSGDTLVVNDITMAFAGTDGAGDVELMIGSIAFSQNGDGSVGIVLPDNLPFTASGSGEQFDGQDFTVTGAFAQTGHAMTASGTPENLTYDYNAATIAVNVEQIIAGDTTLDPEKSRMSFSGTNMSGTTTMTIGETRGYQQSSTLDEVSFDFFFEDPEDSMTSADVSGSAAGIEITGAGTLPLEVADPANIAAMMRSGFDVDGGITYTSGSSEFDVKDPENGNFKMRTNSQGGSFGVKMGQGGLAYDVSQQNMNAAVQMAGLPIPFEVAMAESGFKFALPVAKSDDPQDFGLAITMGDFTMSDVIWGIFDPTSQLPRDPATVMLDVAGKVKLLVDWMNPEAAAQMNGSPGEVETVTLNTLLVDAVGAKLEGSGDITLDNDAPGMIPGMGAPVGDVNFALAGANGLIDKLIEMGILPQEQAMGARMMMGLFAVPGDAPDTLKSKIEFTQDGQILANGQRIR